MSAMDVFTALCICLLPLILIVTWGVGYLKYKDLSEQKDEIEYRLTHSIKLVADLRIENMEKTAAEWFKEVKSASYRNEVEVEIKFIYPLIKYLGYPDAQIGIRVPISIQVGRNSNRGEADWVIWNADPDFANRKALFVIEAKAPTQGITEEVQAQTRSYAFALNAPVYLCTNAKRILLFRRGVENDICVVDCPVSELPVYWSRIQ